MTKSSSTRATSKFLLDSIVVVVTFLVIDEVVVVADDDDDFVQGLSLCAVEGHCEVECVGESARGFVDACCEGISSGEYFLCSRAYALEDGVDDGVCPSCVAFVEDEVNFLFGGIVECDGDGVNVFFGEDDELAGAVAVGDAGEAFFGEVDPVESCEAAVGSLQRFLGEVAGEADLHACDEVVEGTRFDERVAVVWRAADADEGDFATGCFLDGLDEVDEVAFGVGGHQVVGRVEEYILVVVQAFLDGRQFGHVNCGVNSKVVW